MNLDQGLDALGVDATPALIGNLNSFVDDLLKWNKVYNLTAIRDRQQIFTHHIFDSLSVHGFIGSQPVIDVGTGGGFPGIPLAMIAPHQRFTLLDSNGKKTRFLQQVLINRGLTNCEVVQSRAESYSGEFETVVCRAFASLREMIDYAGHLVSQSGRLLAMKGLVEDELKDVPTSFEVEAVHKLVVPGLDADRHLVVMRPVQ